MTKPHFALVALLPLLMLGCPGTTGTDAGVEPDAGPIVPTCEGDVTEWPGEVSELNLDFFLDSGCETLATALEIRPSMLARVDEFQFLTSVPALDVRGQFPAGTNLNELSFIQEVGRLQVSGDGIASLSGLSQLTSLPGGLVVDSAEDLVVFGLSGLESVGGDDIFSQATFGLQLENLPIVEDIDFSDTFEFKSGRLFLRRMPRINGDHVNDIIEAHSNLGEDYKGAVEVCELDPCKPLHRRMCGITKEDS